MKQVLVACLMAYAVAGCGDPGDGSGDDEPVTCGNGEEDGDEECDDGNDVSGDGCSALCRVEAVCGDGVVLENENADCDDSGESATCDADCTFARCGDGTVNASAGEECDDGNDSPDDGCTECLVDEVDPGCPAAASLTCNTGLVFGQITGAGSTDAIDAYACADTDSTGSEVVYEWIATVTGEVTALFKPGGPGLHVVAAEGDTACDAISCLAGGLTGATFAAVEGTRYLIIVDSPDGSTANYGIGMFCP